MTTEDRYLNTKEARKFLGDMSKATFYRNIKRGIIPRQKYLGNTPVWKLSDLQNIELQDAPVSVLSSRPDNQPMPA